MPCKTCTHTYKQYIMKYLMLNYYRMKVFNVYLAMFDVVNIVITSYEAIGIGISATSVEKHDKWLNSLVNRYITLVNRYITYIGYTAEMQPFGNSKNNSARS